MTSVFEMLPRAGGKVTRVSRTSRAAWTKLVASALIGLSAAACGLPAHGPRGAEVVAPREDETKLPYCLVPVDTEVTTVLSRHSPSLAGRFEDRRPSAVVRIGIGDAIGITLYESAAGGLFFPAEGGLRQGNFITLPVQNVDNSGNISVPYAGAIKAAGRTVVEIQRAIVKSLENRALEPQAVVTVTEQRASQVSVIGEVTRPLRFPVSASGERVLDAVARASGPNIPGYDTWLMLEREGKTAVAPFGILLQEPKNNIYVRPDDTIYVFRQPQTFTAFGATGRQGQFPFDAWRINVSEALAKAGGLIDGQAEPSYVFLYRGEQDKVVGELPFECPVQAGKVVPVIYQFDLRDPSGFFLASQMQMRNKDVIYISNSRTVEVGKFLQFIRLVNGTVQDPINTAISGYTLKNLVNGVGSTSTAIVTAR